MKIIVEGSIFELDGRGIARATGKLYKELNRLYPDIEIFLMQEDRLVSPFCDSYKTIRVDRKKDFAGVKEEILKIKPDFIHFPYNGRFCSVFAGLDRNIKTVSTIHDVIPAVIPDVVKMSREQHLVYMRGMHETIVCSDIIITDSECSKIDIKNFFECAKSINVLYIAPILDSQTELGNKLASRKAYFLYNGGYCTRKGIDRIVENFTQARIREKINGQLILTGEIADLGEKTNILIKYGKKMGWILETGYISDEKLVEYIYNARALIYPSLYEGFGLPPLEAMNIGCPVIACQLTSVAEVCGDAAYYVERDSDDEFQIAMESLEKNEHVRQDFISRGFIRAKKFTWEDLAGQFVNILKSKED